MLGLRPNASLHQPAQAVSGSQVRLAQLHHVLPALFRPGLNAADLAPSRIARTAHSKSAHALAHHACDERRVVLHAADVTVALQRHFTLVQHGALANDLSLPVEPHDAARCRV